MRRTTILGVFTVIMLAGVLLFYDVGCPQPGKDLLYERVGHAIGDALFRDRALEAKVSRWRDFDKAAAEIEGQLVAGVISLEEAVKRVHQASLDYHPAYLEHIAFAEVGASDEERIARNLIRHVQEQHADLADLVVRLEHELAMLLKRQPKGTPPETKVSMA